MPKEALKGVLVTGSVRNLWLGPRNGPAALSYLMAVSRLAAVWGWNTKRALVLLTAVALVSGAIGIVGPSRSVFEPGLPAFGPVADAQSQQWCLWYTEAPHKEIARRVRSGGSCPAAPVSPQSSLGVACAYGGTFRSTGNDGVGWWYVSVCNAPPQQWCLWYTEAPHKEIARRVRSGGSCPAAPVSPQSSLGVACAYGGTFRSTGNDGMGWWYVSVCNAPPPSAPTPVCSAATPASVTLMWSKPSGNPMSYRYRLTGGSWTPTINTAATVAGLSSGTEYGFEVQAHNSSGWSSSGSVKCSTALASPSSPSCGTVTSSSVTLNWVAHSQVHQWYIARQVAGGSYADGMSLPGATLTATFSNLESSTSYTFLFWWQKESGGSWFPVRPNTSCSTGETPVITPTPSPTPTPSGSLICGATTTSSITLSYPDGADVYRWFASYIKPDKTNGKWKFVEGGTTSVEFMDLLPDSSYTFRVWKKVLASSNYTALAERLVCKTKAVVVSTTRSQGKCIWFQSDKTTEITSTERINASCPLDTTAQTSIGNAITSKCSNGGEFAQVNPSDDDTADKNAASDGSGVTAKVWRHVLVCFPLGGTGKYMVTKKVLAGVVYAAQTVFAEDVESACKDQAVASNREALTANRLAAIMLSIPVHELAGGAGTAMSPLALSRSDNLGVNFNNVKFYSYRNPDDYKRAYWHSGVGLWQLDTTGEAVQWSHAERADVVKGGIAAAKKIAGNYCEARQDYYAGWFACGEGGQTCKRTYLDIYVSAGDALDVKTVTTPGASGLESVADFGIAERLCRWGDDGEEFECSIYDTGSIFPTGFLTDTVNGSSNQFSRGASKTPLSVPFISFFHEDSMRKYAAWPAKCTGYSKTIIRSVPMDKDIRESPSFDIKYEGISVATDELKKKFIEYAAEKLPLQDVMLVDEQLKSEGWFDNAIVYSDEDIGTIKWDLQIQSVSVGPSNEPVYRWVTTDHLASVSYACNDF